ncbi:MAG: peptidylprolyl isomerase [Acidobacteriota bacterium]
MRRLAAVGIVALLLAGCAGAQRRAPAAGFADERALLLLLEDRRVYEPSAVEQLFGEPAPVREMLALALGRIGDPRGRARLESLLVDGEPTVRRAAAFALGLLKDKAAIPPLLAAAADPDEETGGLAVEALGKLGAEVERVETALGPLPEAERWARLLPALFRFKSPGVVGIATRGLALSDPRLHARAAYALAREPRPEALGRLRELLTDGDPWVRGLAARALGLVGEAGDLDRLREAVADPSAGVVIQALRSGHKLVHDGKAAADPEWAPRVVALLADPRPGVAITALEASASWLAAPALAAEVRRRAADGSEWQREVALAALAEAQDAAAPELVRAAAVAESAPLRQRAATAAGALGLEPTLAKLAADPVAGVRAAALDARLARDGAVTTARVALTDPDPIVRSTALDWLADHPQLPFEELAAAAPAAGTDPLPDARLSAVRALRARAAAQPTERGAVVERLERVAAQDPEFLVRRAAADALVALDRPRPAIGPAAPTYGLDYYRDVVRQTARPRRVEIVTSRGALWLRLDCPQAPLTCLSFLKLAEQGYFNGLTFHRVVPDFVVQGGDPRGDGSGGPGYSLRDELNRLRYERGAVGMALSGPDTGGSQFFITLSPQPHLDGGYTVFAAVERGMDVADRIEQGDRIESVVERREGALPR